MSVPMCTIRHGRTRRGRRKHGYWVPAIMRARNRTTRLVVRLCGRCEEPKSHAIRTNGDGIRRYCVDCEAEILKEWRAANWQRVKLRDTHRGMIDRCHNPERMKRWAAAAGIAGAWRDYGAAGVKVCERWRGEGGFERFCEDVGVPPTKVHTLDRVDPLGDYSCGRCSSCVQEVLMARPKPHAARRPGDRVGPYELVRREGSHWIARCQRGHERKILPRVVERRAAQGRIRGCAQCVSDDVPRDPAFPFRAHNLVDMTGLNVGMLTVLSAAPNGEKSARWLCRCDCGREKVISRAALLATLEGRPHGTRSCGCAKKGINAGPRGSSLPLGEVERRTVLKTYRDGAAARGLEWALSPGGFLDLIGRNCFYCGLEPSNSIKAKRLEDDFVFRYSGIDRKDNAVGYLASNCVACCSTCNHAKHTMSVDEFFAWVTRLSSNVRLKFKGNVRWADKATQDANRKNSVFLEWRDPVTGDLVSLTISEWCRRLGLNRKTVYNRRKKGLPLEEVLAPSSSAIDPSVPF